MAFFQNSVINKYLTTIDKQAIEASYAQFKAYFHNPERQQNIREAKEEQFQEGFLREFFVNIMGYILYPEPAYNLTTEHKNVKDSKKVDGAIIIDGAVKGVIELKGTDTTDLSKIENQAFGYKNNQPECLYVITSNFEKIRFYIDNAIDHLEFNLFTLSSTEFELLWLCLAYVNIQQNIPQRIKDESISQEDEITKILYKDYSLFKRELHQNLVRLNPQYDPLTLFKKSQKLLDRFLFLFFAEDRLLLPPNSVRLVLNDWRDLQERDVEVPLYDRFKKYFEYLNTGYKGKRYDVYAYNGGLFKPEKILDTINIDDELLFEHTKNLSEYDFASEIDVNILGHIFENSLNELDEIKAQLEGLEIDKSKTKRKKDGVFYTPKYITKYIVENTLGKLCAEKKDELQIRDEDYTTDKRRQIKTKQFFIDKLAGYRNWLLQLTVCDPACGSGAFLNQALDFLINEHRYIDELHAKLFGDALVFSDFNKSILENNLFGVDLNEESVEIAKLSLWLRTAQPNRKLNDLSNNIKCGNSLIDDPDIAGAKAFKWHQEFPQVFEKGGFDVVIGNPPYVDIKALPENIVEYVFTVYKTANNRINLFSVFIEKAFEILKAGGKFSFIIPSSILTQDSYKLIRNKLLTESNLNCIIRLPNESFGGSAGEVKVDTIILTFTLNSNISSPIEIIVYKGFNRINEINQFNCDAHLFIDQSLWSKDDNSIFRINVNNNISNILLSIEKETVALSECADFCLGLTPYDKYKGHSPDEIKDRIYHSKYKKDETFKKLLAGNDVRRYYIEWNGDQWISYGCWLGAPRQERFFKEKRILVKQIIDWTAKQIWASITDEELYNTQNAFNLISHETYYTEYLLAVINSKLMSFYHRKKYLEEYKDRFQKILIKDCKDFPIRSIVKEKQQPVVGKVELMLSRNKELHEISVKFQNTLQRKFDLVDLSRRLQEWYVLSYKELIAELEKMKTKLSLSQEAEWEDYFVQESKKALELKAKIDATDKEIDRMVYELYGLTEEEVKIIEGR